MFSYILYTVKKAILGGITQIFIHNNRKAPNYII